MRFKNRYLIADMIWKNEGDLEAVWGAGAGSGWGGVSRTEASATEIFGSLRDTIQTAFGDLGWATAQASLQGEVLALCEFDGKLAGDEKLSS